MSRATSRLSHPSRAALAPTLLLLSCGMAYAQMASQPETPAAGVKPGPVVGAVEFSDEPFHLDSAGLTMQLAIGCGAEKMEMGDKATVRIQPKTGSWIMNILTQRTSNPTTTPAQAVDEIVTQIFKQSGEAYDAADPSKLVGVVGAVVEPRRALKLPGGDAERVYIKTPGGSGPPLIRGYTVFRTSPTQFVTFELIAGEPLFAKARVPYEAMVGTASFDDPSAAGTSRAAAIASGKRVLEQFDIAAMKQLVESRGERWERLYKPASTGANADATELGYRRIRASLGSRASMNGGASGGEEGYIIKLDARNLLPDSKGGPPRIVDTQAVYFMSFDRSEEVWNVRMAVRDNNRIATTAAETGARSGQSMSVQIESTGQPTKQVRPVMQTDGYVSRVEALLLPSMIVKSGVQTDLGFYVYQSEAETVRLRRDLLEQPADKPGVLRLTTKLGDDARRTQISYFNEQGDFLRTEMPDGSIWESTRLESLGALWRAKGLPLD